MPVYTFQNKQTEEEWTDIMSISAKEQYLIENPNIQQLLTSLNMVSGVGGIRTDGGFNEVLHKIVENHPNSDLASSFGSAQSSKEVKTRQVVEKWRKKRAADNKK